MSLKVEITQDGSQVCCLLGDSLMTGIAGFGDTVNEALHSLARETAEYDTIETLEAALKRSAETGEIVRPQP